MNKLFFFLSVVLLLGTATMSTTSCGDETEYEGPDTVIFKFYNVIHFDGDTVAFNNETHVDITNSGDLIDNDTTVFTNDNHLHNSPEVEVNGGTTTVNGGDNTTSITNGDGGGNTTNNGTGGGNGDGSGDNGGITISEGCSLWGIPAEEFPSRVLYSIYRAENDSNKALFERREISTNQKAIAFYDGTSEGKTSLSFPFKNEDVWTTGTFGATADKRRTIYALRIGETASIGLWSYGNTLSVTQQFLLMLEENFVLCGLAGSDGNSPNERTGRTLLGTDGKYVYLFVAENATTQEAFDAFVRTGVCPPSQIMTVSGGSSSQGRKPVPLWVNITSEYQLF